MVSRRRWVKEIALALVLSFPGGILFQFRRFWLLIDSWSNAEFLFGKIASAKTGTSPPSTPPNMTWWDWPFTSQGSTTLMVIGLLWIGACVLWRVGRLALQAFAPRPTGPAVETLSASMVPPSTVPAKSAVRRGALAPRSALRLGTADFPTTDSLIKELKELYAIGSRSTIMNRSAPPPNKAFLLEDEKEVPRFEERAVGLLKMIARPDEVAGFREIGSVKPDFMSMRIGERYVYSRSVMNAKLEKLHAITDRLEEASRNTSARGNPHELFGRVLSDGKGGTRRWARADLSGLDGDDREELFNIHPELRSWWLAGR